MNLSEKIQRLRKARGLSQDELGAQLGVSRQAVSKWESGQSVPDVEKIVVLSEFFGVTCDYLLKEKEEAVCSAPVLATEGKKPNADLFFLLGTAVNLVGLIVGSAAWHQFQTELCVALELTILLIGCVGFVIGLSFCDRESAEAVKKRFYQVNIWIVAFPVLSLCVGIVCWGFGTPYPVWDIKTDAICILLYMAVCTGFQFLSQIKSKK